MQLTGRWLSRRGALKILGAASGGLAVSRWLGPNATIARPSHGAQGGQEPAEKAIEPFTGPGPNPYWNSVAPYVTKPQNVPLILLTSPPVQLPTPRHYLRPVFTPTPTFFLCFAL